MFGQTRYSVGGAIIILAVTALGSGCKKESDSNLDAGATSSYPVLEKMKSRVFSFSHSFDSKVGTHHLSGTNKKALIYFAAHDKKKNVLNFLKVVQDALTGTHDVFGGRALFSDADTAKLITDYYCPGTVLTPTGSTLDAIFAQMKACETTSDLGATADSAVPDMGGDLSTADASTADASTADASTADASASDATADSGATGTAYDLKIEEAIKNRLYIRDDKSRLTLSRVFYEEPRGVTSDVAALLNVYERVTYQNSCTLSDPREYLLLYAGDKGKLLYSRVKDLYSKSGTFDVEEGTVTVVGNELTLDPVFAGKCKSKLKLNPARLPVYPVNLWLSSSNCIKRSATQEVFYSSKTDRKCSSVDVTELALKGSQNSMTYITRKSTAFPATTGTSAHKLWSVVTSP